MKLWANYELFVKLLGIRKFYNISVNKNYRKLSVYKKFVLDTSICDNVCQATSHMMLKKQIFSEKWSFEGQNGYHCFLFSTRWLHDVMFWLDFYIPMSLFTWYFFSYSSIQFQDLISHIHLNNIWNRDFINNSLGMIPKSLKWFQSLDNYFMLRNIHSKDF